MSLPNYTKLHNQVCTDIDSCIGDHQVKLAWNSFDRFTCRKVRFNSIISAEDSIDRMKKRFNY